MKAILGATGFVGGVLAKYLSDAEKFNSKTIGNTLGRAFDTVYCAAAPSSMFEANRFPEIDEARVATLIESIEQIEAKQFVLISSIAVLEDFGLGQTEATDAYQTNLAYGRNRRWLEDVVISKFEHSLIVRLPALFGSGLVKNFIFDLMNPVPSMLTTERFETARGLSGKGAEVEEIYHWDASIKMYKVSRDALVKLPARPALEAALIEAGLSAVGFHNPQTTYQFYNLENIVSDCGMALKAGLSCIHLAPEPTTAAEVHKALLGTEMPNTCAALHREDLRSRHASLWGQNGDYIAPAERVITDLSAFFQTETESR